VTCLRVGLFCARREHMKDETLQKNLFRVACLCTSEIVFSTCKL
jgi:hypothetical protein